MVFGAPRSFRYAWQSSSRKKKQFRGEKINIIVGEVEKFIKPTSEEGDAWSGKILMNISNVLKIMDIGTDHENMYPYRIAQRSVLNMLKLMQKN